MKQKNLKRLIIVKELQNENELNIGKEYIRR